MEKGRKKRERERKEKVKNKCISICKKGDNRNLGPFFFLKENCLLPYGADYKEPRGIMNSQHYFLSISLHIFT